MTSRSTSNGEIKYSPIIDTTQSDYRGDFHSMESGLPPVENGGSSLYHDSQSRLKNGSIDKLNNSTGRLSNGTTQRIRTMSVDEVTQTKNGGVITLPSLHIPGEAGELADMNKEMKHTDELSTHDVGPETLRKVYAQVSSLLSMIVYLLFHVLSIKYGFLTHSSSHLATRKNVSVWSSSGQKWFIQSPLPDHQCLVSIHYIVFRTPLKCQVLPERIPVGFFI